MSDQSNARIISIILALCVVVGGWLLPEYDTRSRSSSQVAKTSGRPVDDPSPSSPPPSLPKPMPASSVANRPPVSANTAVMYECEKNGRVSFTDQPCDNGEKTISVATFEREPPRDHRRELSKMKAKAEKMKSERLASERAIASTQGRDSDVVSEKALRCKRIDDAIALVDSRLRRPHSGQRGDQLNAQRKRLNDLRFSINC